MSPTPTLDALLAFAKARPRGAGNAGLMDIGLIVGDPEIEFLRGDDTPANSEVFAHTGGDSVHFCLLEIGGAVVEQSPRASDQVDGEHQAREGLNGRTWHSPTIR